MFNSCDVSFLTTVIAIMFVFIFVEFLIISDLIGVNNDLKKKNKRETEMNNEIRAVVARYPKKKK